jgi:hypothetical protein
VQITLENKFKSLTIQTATSYSLLVALVHPSFVPDPQMHGPTSYQTRKHDDFHD